MRLHDEVKRPNKVMTQSTNTKKDAEASVTRESLEMKSCVPASTQSFFNHTTTMTERYQRTPLVANGNSTAYLQIQDEERVVRRAWRRILQFDEWTFTLLLFLFSSSIVIGKLFFNHDFFSFLDINTDRFIVPAVNTSHPYYKDVTENSVIEPLNRYSWFIKALLSGLATTGITWFIIYEDSSEPGVNPPSPFSPSKKNYYRIQKCSPVQLNYFCGFLNGLLIFFYMCL